MVSATDVITYIGVPLAVLGVLPILYTFSTALYTRLRIARVLKKNDIESVLSTRLMSGMVNADMPIYELNPRPRTESAYWKEVTLKNNIQAAHWRSYPWIRTPVPNAYKTMRFQMRDPVAIPEARVKFHVLMDYLLDIGAIVSTSGFRNLRTTGPNIQHSIDLMVADSASTVPILSVVKSATTSSENLCLQLHPPSALFKRHKRNEESFPPGWFMLSRNVPSASSLPPTSENKSSASDGATKASEPQPDPQGNKEIATFIGTSRPDPASLARCREIYVPSDFATSLRERNWLPYIICAALCDKGNMIEIKGSPCRMHIEPEILLYCRNFVLPAGYLAHDSFSQDLFAIDDRGYAIQEAIDIHLQEICPPRLVERISDLKEKCLTFDETAKLIRIQTRLGRLFGGSELFPKHSKSYVPSRVLSLKDDEMRLSTYAALRDPSFYNNISKYLNSLYNDFVRGDDKPKKLHYLKHEDFRNFIFALTIMKAIGKHAENLLRWNDIEVCLDKYEWVDLI